MVRPVQTSGADNRRARDRVPGKSDDRQVERRRQPEHRVQVSNPRHPRHARIQGRPGRRAGRRPHAERRIEESSGPARLMADAPRNVIIVGSGPAGLTAALYTARANLQPLLIEGLEAGGQLMLTTMVENFPGFRDGIMGPELMAEMRAQAERFGATIVQGHVTKVDLSTRPFVLTTD